MGIYLNRATGFNLPPFWLNRPVKALPPEAAGESLPSNVRPPELAEEHSTYFGNLWQDKVSLKFRSEREWWSLPLDPVISVSGKNIIVRRNVAKTNFGSDRRGSVKEQWSGGDYEVNIAGSLTNRDMDIPETELKKLKIYCEAKEPVEVRSRLLEIFGVRYMVIEDYTLPFTKGIENQMYTIKAYSDDIFNDLLIKN